MFRVFLIALGGGILVLAVAMLVLGAFPPKPHVHQVQHAVPTATLAVPASPAASPDVALPAAPPPPQPAAPGH